MHVSAKRTIMILAQMHCKEFRINLIFFRFDLFQHIKHNELWLVTSYVNQTVSFCISEQFLVKMSCDEDQICFFFLLNSVFLHWPLHFPSTDSFSFDLSFISEDNNSTHNLKSHTNLIQEDRIETGRSETKP